MGASTCQDDIADFKCVCRPGFTGKYCQGKTVDCAPNTCNFRGNCIENEENQGETMASVQKSVILDHEISFSSFFFDSDKIENLIKMSKVYFENKISKFFFLKISDFFPGKIFVSEKKKKFRFFF